MRSKLLDKCSAIPQANPCNYRQDHHENLTNGFLNLGATGDKSKVEKAEHLGDNDIFLVSDGDKSGNHGAMLQAFSFAMGNGHNVKMQTAVPKTNAIIYEQQSVEDRAPRVQGIQNLHERQGLLVTTRSNHNHPVKDRLIYSGTPSGSNIYPVKLNGHSPPHCWRETPAQNK